ncbi:MAG TPA: MMPL family transporter, partial [Mycobacteriales bacterium]|nr:MMPL family transporter [Mycobacteriales bacterium]
MATLLYKIGRFAFRRRWYVILAWLAVLVVVGMSSATASAPPPDKFTMPGTESQRAFDLMKKRFPSASADGATATMVFKARNGEKITEGNNRTAVGQVLDKLKGKQVSRVSNALAPETVSKKGTTAYATVTYKVPAGEITAATRNAVERAAKSGRSAGLTVEIGGDVVKGGSPPSSEAIGIAIAAVILVITFGSLVAAGLPLLTALIGVGIAVSSVGALAATLGLSNTTSILGTMIGLAVGIDYALFITSRYRAELANGHSRDEAAGRAVGTSGSAVVFAGLTVVVALSGLAIINLPLLTRMGLVAAGAVIIAVLIALTLVPAALGLVGKRIFGKKVRKRNPETGVPLNDSNGKPNRGTRWSKFVLRHPVALLLAGVVVLGTIASPVAALKLGMPSAGTAPTKSTQRKAYDMLSDGFGPGFNGPLMLVLDTTGSKDPKAAADSVIKEISNTSGVTKVSPARFNPAGDTAMISVTPADGPSSTKTEDLVSTIRDKSKDLTKQTGAAELLVTGPTAANIDFSKRMSDALTPYLALVVGLAFLLLMIVFRSVLVPLKAALGFLLSLLASLGTIVAVFQWGWLGSLFGVDATGPIMSMMPIFLIGIVFGLAMDYEVFLVTRIREGFVHGEHPKQAVVTGFKHGTRVVTAAALIMIGVFSGFIFGGESMIKMIGLGLATAVFFDAFIVRMTIVPATLALLGKAAWWLPRWLNAILPNVDVEGERLQKRLAGVAAAAEQTPSVGIPVAIKAAAPLPEVPVVVQPGVQGRVMRGNGVPVPGTMITVVNPSGHQAGRATVGEDGGFSIDLPHNGTYVMVAHFVGHPPTVRTVAVSDGLSVSDVLLAGDGGLVGTVALKITGARIAGATVVLTDGQGTVVHSRVTDDEGRYAFYHLAAGSYTVTATATSLRPASSNAQVPEVGFGRHDMRLAGDSGIRGVVRAGKRGQPLPEAQVALTDVHGRVVATAVT